VVENVILGIVGKLVEVATVEKLPETKCTTGSFQWSELTAASVVDDNVHLNLLVRSTNQIMPDYGVDLCPAKLLSGSDSTVAAENCIVRQDFDRILEPAFTHVGGQRFDLSVGCSKQCLLPGVGFQVPKPDLLDSIG
jgi:hypothetical protein